MSLPFKNFFERRNAMRELSEVVLDQSREGNSSPMPNILERAVVALHAVQLSAEEQEKIARALRLQEHEAREQQRRDDELAAMSQKELIAHFEELLAAEREARKAYAEAEQAIETDEAPFLDALEAEVEAEAQKMIDREEEGLARLERELTAVANRRLYAEYKDTFDTLTGAAWENVEEMSEVMMAGINNDTMQVLTDTGSFTVIAIVPPEARATMSICLDLLDDAEFVQDNDIQINEKFGTVEHQVKLKLFEVYTGREFVEALAEKKKKDIEREEKRVAVREREKNIVLFLGSTVEKYLEGYGVTQQSVGDPKEFGRLVKEIRRTVMDYYDGDSTEQQVRARTNELAMGYKLAQQK